MNSFCGLKGGRWIASKRDSGGQQLYSGFKPDLPGLDAPTDVLSFNLQDDVTDFEADSILGDVVVSLEKAAEQAAAYRHSLKREVAFLTLHGILHLLGYDHETPEEEREMNEKAELVLKKYKI